MGAIPDLAEHLPAAAALDGCGADRRGAIDPADQPALIVAFGSVATEVDVVIRHACSSMNRTRGVVFGTVGRGGLLLHAEF
jgi:hypothetical protein